MNKQNTLEKSNVENILPLIGIQEGMLFHYISNPDSKEYYEQLSLTLTGKVSPELVEKAWNAVVESNEMLRTIYRWEKLEKPIQIILKKLEVKVRFHDLSNLKEKDRRSELDRIKKDDINSYIDITNETFRVLLCKISDEESEMIIGNHHIIYDGWSNGIILKEFLQAYKALSAGELPERVKKNRFQELIKWYKLQDKNSQKEYWSNYLENYDINDDIFNGVSDARELTCYSYKITDELCERTVNFARENKVSLSTVLYSIWGILLHKLNNTDDIVFGTTISGRNVDIKDVDEIVGLFINTIPLRIKINPGDTVGGIIFDADTSLEKRGRFENTSFIDIKEYCGLRPRQNLFNSIVVVENYPLDFKKMELDGLFKISDFSMIESTNFNMTLGIIPFNGIELNFKYCNCTVRDSLIRRLGEYFENILEIAVKNKNTKVFDIEIISDEEKRRILGSFNNTDAEYMKEKTIHGLLEEQVKKTPDKTAVIFGDEKLSYRELNEKTNMLARTLRKRGIRSDSIVGIMVERSVEMLIGIFGILKAGGAYLPIDPEYPEDRVNYMLEDSKANVLLTRKRYKEGISFPGVVVNVDDKNEYDRDGSNLDASGSSGDLAYVIYTSGSTGKPKGAMIEHHSVINRIFWMNKAYPIDGNDVILQKTTYTFDVSVWELFWWSFVGAGVCLLENKGEKDPDVIIESIKKNNVTVMHFVPSMFNSFLHYIEMKGNFEEIAGLKQIFCSGEALSVKHIEMFNRITDKARHIKLINLYGPTEATVDVSHYECRREEKTGVIPIGKPIDNIRLYIIGSNRELQPIGLAGELCISGVGLARGYLNKPELTEEKFIDNPFEPGKKMYRTGDLARWMPDGNIEYLGRMDFQVKIRGFRIELGEIESVLRKHTGVKDAVVTAKSVGNEGGDKKLVAYLVPKEGETLIETQLREYLGEKLPEYMVPTVYVMMDEIPLTSSGKANIRALPEPETADLRSKEEYVAPSTDTEKKLAEVWGKVLGIEKVSINDNFFNLGGDSILSIQVMALAKKNGLDLSIQQLFKYPTIRGLSQTLSMTETAAKVSTRVFSLISDEDRSRLLSMQRSGR
jgi:amino acid adenylation domain-containing protein